jgi:hypothetical protein
MAPDNFQERRRGPDFLLRLISITGIVSALVLIVVLIVLQKAKPTYVTSLEIVRKTPIRKNWDGYLLYVAFILNVVIFYFSGIGLMIKTRRSKRTTDKYPISLIILWLLSFAAIIIYFLK